MTIRNRELSQFGSFISIDDETQNISITDSEYPYIGIGTTNPQEKLQVDGNVKVNGDLIVDGAFDFDFGNFTFEGDVNINSTGIVTASRFVDDNGILTVSDRWDSDGTNIYRLNGNVGVGIEIPSEKLEVSQNIKASRFISTVSGTRFSGTPPFEVASSFVVNNLNATYLQGGIPGGTSSGDIVTIDSNQILTSKAIGGGGIVFNGSTSGSTTLKATSVAGSGSVNLPTTTGTLICTGDTGTVTSGMISNGTIVNDDVNASAAIAYSKLNLNNSITNNDLSGSITNNKLVNSTISGVSLGGNLFTLTPGNFLTGSNYNGSSAITFAVNASTTGTSNVVARDGTGSFNAGSITLSSNLNATGGTVSGNALSAGSGGITASGAVNITNTTDSTSTTTGALRVGGGLGIANNTYIGGLVNVAGTSQLSNTTISGITSVTNTQNATSTTTGALRVSGGLGVANDVYIGGNLNITGSITVGSGGLNQVLHLRHTENRNVSGGTLSAGSWQKRKLNSSVTNSITNSSFDSVNFEFVLPSGSYDINVTVPAYSVNTHQSRITSTAGNSVTIYGTTEYANQPAGADKSQGFSRSTIRGVIDITTPTTFQIQHRVESSQTTDGGGLPTSFGTGGNLQPGNEIYTEVFIRKLL